MGIPISCIVWETYEDFLANNYKGGGSHLEQGLSFYDPWHLKYLFMVVPPFKVFKNYILISF